MHFVTRLLIREELDALELELAQAKRAHEPEFLHIQRIKLEIARLEAKIHAARVDNLRGTLDATSVNSNDVEHHVLKPSRPRL